MPLLSLKKQLLKTVKKSFSQAKIVHLSLCLLWQLAYQRAIVNLKEQAKTDQDNSAVQVTIF